MLRLIQIGANTQTQGQLMKPVSFRVMKTMVRRPEKPIPPDEDDDEELIVCEINRDGHPLGAF